MTYSNLSKIKTKFRTSGAISQPRRKAGSPLNDIGGDGNIGSTQDEYLNRLYHALDHDIKHELRQFIHIEIRKIHIQRGTW